MPLPRLEFAFPKQRRLVYLGATGNPLLQTYINEDDFTIYQSVRSECNIWVALLSIVTGRWSSRGYYKSFLKLVQPAVVITF